MRYALDAAKYAQVQGLDPVVARKLDILRNGIVLPAPTTPGRGRRAEPRSPPTSPSPVRPAARARWAASRSRARTSRPRWATSIALRLSCAEMWASWHDNVGAPMKDDYARMVEIANAGREGARLQRHRRDVALELRHAARRVREAMVDGVWDDLKPLYIALHTYVRTKLNEKYGDAVQAADRPDPRRPARQHVGAGMGNLYPLVAPPGAGDLGYDLTELLEAERHDEARRWSGRARASSPRLGSSRLPDTFWQRSLFLKPADREVQSATPSAWDIDNVDDLRIKMCIKINADDFTDRSTTSWGTTTTSAPTTSRATCIFPTAPTTASTKRSATSSRCRSRPNTSVQIGLLDPRPGAERRQGHRPAAAPGDGQGRVPALRPAGRQMALGRVRRLDPACRSTTRRGSTLKPSSIRASRRRSSGRLTRSIRARSTTSRQHALHALLPRAACCSSSSTRRRASRPDGPGRCTAARFYGNKEVGAKLERRCWRWGPASRGPTRSRPSPARARSAARRWPNTSRR